ncbi:hypothetical protein EXIGLDRAFT_769926 [Exidia glandulosa HHB12029]|uniref:Uncharacterized protein n=1 Tax=Exidia glandulosa HHB12029 TaxID=1314781 RepID=A0A165H341_EXIGL|nr:hypothetical protein EXIGLDRAFT_769926 [Exidia glandulosa HHB12029]
MYAVTEVFPDVADGSLSHVTHLEGCLPSQFTHIKPCDWVPAILAAVPALTCLAFNIAAADFRSKPPYLGGDADTLPDILRLVLERRTVQRVVLHLPRDHISNWPMFKATLSRFNDSRIYVWRDERIIDIWEGDVERVAEEDAWAARDVWTEAGPWDQ